ncbi:MAG: CoA transferase, partial [Dehalococcoidia bacterium]
PGELMENRQAAGVAGGVCETAEERMFRDPQLQHGGFQAMLPNSFVGEWQVKDFPVKLSESPAYVGGTLGRGFPCYGEDNDYVYGTLLGMPKSDQERLAEEEVI